MTERPPSRADVVAAIQRLTGADAGAVVRLMAVVDSYAGAWARYLSLQPRDRDPMGSRSARVVMPTEGEWVRCKGCGQFKPAAEYYPRGPERRLVQPCKVCMNKRAKRQRKERQRRVEKLVGKHPDVAAALLPPPRFTGEQREEAIRRYQDGLSMRQVAAEVGCGVITVSRWLSEAGVPARPAGQNGPPQPAGYPPELREAALEMLRGGASSREVAEKFDISSASVRRWAKKTGEFV